MLLKYTTKNNVEHHDRIDTVKKTNEGLLLSQKEAPYHTYFISENKLCYHQFQSEFCNEFLIAGWELC